MPFAEVKEICGVFGATIDRIFGVFKRRLAFVIVDPPSGNWLATSFIEIREELREFSLGGRTDSARVRVSGKSSTVMGWLRRWSCGETFSVGRVRVASEAAGGETTVVGRTGVVGIRMLVVLFREVDAIRRGTGLEAPFSGSV